MHYGSRSYGSDTAAKEAVMNDRKTMHHIILYGCFVTTMAYSLRNNYKLVKINQQPDTSYKLFQTYETILKTWNIVHFTIIKNIVTIRKRNIN